MLHKYTKMYTCIYLCIHMQININANCWDHMFVCIWFKADHSILDRLRKLIFGSIWFSFSSKSLVSCCSLSNHRTLKFSSSMRACIFICLCFTFVTAVISWSIISQLTSWYPCFYNISVPLTQCSWSLRGMSWAVL